MEGVIVFLIGFVVGGITVRFLMRRAQRRWLRPHQLDEQYRTAQRVVHRHFMNHDTLNAGQLDRLMDIRPITAQRYLDQLERDRLVRRQEHAKTGAFYTRY